MRNYLAWAVSALAVAACGDNKKPGDNGIDAPPGTPGDMQQADAAIDAVIDAPIDAPPAPAMITLSGTAAERSITGQVPVANATIAAFSNSDETTPLATTTTNAQGAFSFMVPTGGFAINGFLKATKTGLKDTYLYPAGFIATDLAMIPMLMATQASYEALSTLARGNQMPGMGLIALQVLDGPPPAGLPVAMAMVSSNPAASVYRYNNVSGLPDFMPMSTHTDGVAYMFNVPPNVNVVVSAAKTGVTFSSHNMKAWPDQLTTTFISP